MKRKLNSWDACLGPFGSQCFIFLSAIQKIIKIYETVIIFAVLCCYETWFLPYYWCSRANCWAGYLGTQKMTGAWKRLHNVELSNFCFSPDVTRITISMRMRWARHMARMEDAWEMYTKFWVKGLKERKFCWRNMLSTVSYQQRTYRIIWWLLVPKKGPLTEELLSHVVVQLSRLLLFTMTACLSDVLGSNSKTVCPDFSEPLSIL
jgi:hypothetical protein